MVIIHIQVKVDEIHQTLCPVIIPRLRKEYLQFFLHQLVIHHHHHPQVYLKELYSAVQLYYFVANLHFNL